MVAPISLGIWAGVMPAFFYFPAVAGEARYWSNGACSLKIKTC